MARLLYWMPNNFYLSMRLAALLLLLLLTACGGRKGAVNNSGHAAGTVSVTAGLPVTFYKCYSGTVAGRPVVLQLTSYNGDIQGTYYYTGIGQNISLAAWGDSTAAQGELILHELPAVGVPEEDKLPTCACASAAALRRANGSARMSSSNTLLTSKKIIRKALPRWMPIGFRTPQLYSRAIRTVHWQRLPAASCFLARVVWALFFMMR